MSNSVEILLVEDNPADVKLTRLGLKQAKITNTLHVVGDGLEALAFLHNEGEHVNAVRPDLVLLDLKLPKKSGHEVLEVIKADKTLKRIPVVILTTSEDEWDVFQSYNHHANGYIVKPVDFNGFVKVVQAIDDFWFTVVKLPKE